MTRYFQNSSVMSAMQYVVASLLALFVYMQTQRGTLPTYDRSSNNIKPVDIDSGMGNRFSGDTLQNCRPTWYSPVDNFAIT